MEEKSRRKKRRSKERDAKERTIVESKKRLEKSGGTGTKTKQERIGIEVEVAQKDIGVEKQRDVAMDPTAQSGPGNAKRAAVLDLLPG